MLASCWQFHRSLFVPSQSISAKNNEYWMNNKIHTPALMKNYCIFWGVI